LKSQTFATPQCGCCEVKAAIYFTYEDAFAENSSSVWCEECYEVFHFKADGERSYDDFKVLRFECDM
jgi:snRNA-activating protein complex subunit 3